MVFPGITKASYFKMNIHQDRIKLKKIKTSIFFNVYLKERKIIITLYYHSSFIVVGFNRRHFHTTHQGVGEEYKC